MARIDDVKSIGLDPAGYQPGWLDSLPFTQPAAGQAFTRTVPAELSERLIAVTFALTPSAVAGNRQAVLSVLDDQGATVDQYQAGPPVGAGFAYTAFLARRSVPDTFQAQSLNGEGSVLGPGAGAVIASTGNVPEGKYSVTVIARLGGTTAGADGNNMQLQVGANVVSVINIGSSSGSVVTYGPVNVDAPGGVPITVNAVGAGTGTATYNVDITATLIEGATYYGSLPEILLPTAWSWRISVVNMGVADQISAVNAVMWRYPTTALLPSPGG